MRFFENIIKNYVKLKKPFYSGIAGVGKAFLCKSKNINLHNMYYAYNMDTYY